MENPDLQPYAVSIIHLLQGPVYSEDKCWEELLLYRREITAHWRQLGIELIVEEKDGYAFLHQVEDENKNTIGLIKRIAMTYEQTLMCVLLREWLDEFEVKDTDNRNLYITHRQCRERIEMFFKGSPNEVKLVKNLDSLVKDMLGFGFLKKFGEPESQEDARYEVRRIIKSRITADKLLEFKQNLETYV